MHSPKTARRLALKTFAFTLALGALAACSPDTLKFKSIDITGADYVKGFALADHNGVQRSLADFKGKAVVVFLASRSAPTSAPPH